MVVGIVHLSREGKMRFAFYLKTSILGKDFNWPGLFSSAIQMKSKSWTSENIAAPRDQQGQCEGAECGQCTDSNPASIGADLQNVLNIDAGRRTMNHFSSVGASQPVLSGKKPDKQRPDLRSLCHEEATGRGGEPSNPIATHFLLYFWDPALHIPLWYIFLWSMLDSFSIVFALRLREKFANLLNWAFPDVGLVGSRKFCKTLPQTRTVGWEPTCPTSYVPTNQPPTTNNRQSRSTITINGKIRSCKETINNQTDTSIALSFPPM